LVRDHDLFARTYLICVALLLLLPNPATARNLFYFVVLPCFALAIDWTTWARVARSWTLRFAALLLFWLWLTLFWSDSATPSQITNTGRKLLLILAFVAATAHLIATTPGFATRLFRWVAYAGALAAAAAISWTAIRSPILPFMRVGAFPFPNSNASGAVYGAALTGAFWYLWLCSPKRWQTGRDAPALAVLGSFLLLTQSRGAVMALAVALSICFISVRGIRPAAMAVAAGALVLGLLFGFGVIDPAPLLERGDSYRVEAWAHYLNVWRQHPFLGIGLNAMPTFMSADGVVEIVHAHNMYLSHLVLGGVPALALLLLMLIAAARAAWRSHVNANDIGLAALLVFILVSGLFDFTVFVDAAGWQWLYFWLPIGLIAGAEAAQRMD
jgi:O-antigen ligase